MFQALAMAVFGENIGFGLTLEQALEPNYFDGGPQTETRNRSVEPVSALRIDRPPALQAD